MKTAILGIDLRMPYILFYGYKANSRNSIAIVLYALSETNIHLVYFREKELFHLYGRLLSNENPVEALS